MLDIYTVSFFGHRQIENLSLLESQLENIITNIISGKEYVEFLVGNNGEFDILVSQTIRRLKKIYDSGNVCHTLVLPYETAVYRNNLKSFEEYYDNVEIFESLERTHYKALVLNRNYKMVDRSDLIVFYLERKVGGAYKTFKYAEKENKNVKKLEVYDKENP